MKILHTADWHVGKLLRGRSRADEHRAVLDEIAQLARAEDVDVVIVAGDLFDLSAPVPESEGIVYRALLALADDARHVIVVAGNHDHPQRLAAVRPLLDLTRVRVRTHVARPEQGGVVDIRARSGETARIASLPFLSQRGIISAGQLMTNDAHEHTLEYGKRCRAIVEALCEGFDAGCINVLVSHLTVVGGALGGGEREAHTVVDYHVPAQVFPATAHYVALGHLHRAQRIHGACPIWYSGAPLQLDFGESANAPAVLIIEAEPAAPARVREVPLQAGRRLRTLRGATAQLEALRDEVGDAFLRVFVTEPARAGLGDEVRALFANAVEVIVAPADAQPTVDAEWTLAHVRRSPVELFAEFLSEKRVKDPAILALFQALLEDVGVPV